MAILEDVFRNALKKSMVQTIWYHIILIKRYGNLETKELLSDRRFDFENEEITLIEAKNRSWLWNGEEVSEEVEINRLREEELFWLYKTYFKIHEHDKVQVNSAFNGERFLHA
jgi:hypothetical protein